MNQTIKRRLSLLLCAVMLLSLFPIGATAATTEAVETNVRKILTDAYALESGASLAYTATLTGKIKSIKDAYNENFGNISVWMEMPGYADMPILCYRMKGEGVETLKLGDTITVTGNIKNYVKTNADTGETTSTIEFTPCTLAAVNPDTGNGSDYTGPNFPGLYSLAVVGSGLPGISEWIPGDPAGDMSQVSYGVYVKHLTCSAGTSMKLKIQGNDAWVDRWNFGSATLILGQKADLENSGGSRDMSLSVEKDCTIKITVDLNPMTNGGAATILVEEVADGGNTGTTKKVTLSIKVPASWTKVYAYSWDSTGATIMGDWPGAQVPKSGDWYKGLINGDVNNLIINNGFMQSEDLYIQNGKDVWVVVSENIDGNYKYKATVTYTEPVSEPKPEHYPGDINGDDKLNIGDVSKLYAHVRGTNTLTDPDVLARADVSGDGKLNIADVSKLYAYVRGVSPEAVVDAAYRLQENDQMTKPVTLTGTVTEILEPYNSKYKAVTLVIQIDGRADKPIICSRLRGDDAAYVMAGDTVTVTGILQNYYGSVEFAEGCTLDKWVDVPSLEEQQWAAVDAAYQLPENSSMDRKETLTGKVISIDQAYASNLPYISITIAVPGREDKPIGCYRLVGADIALVKIGDTVTVAGTLRNYYGTVEFAANCSLVDYTPDGTTVETDPLRIVDAAYSLAKDTQMAYDVALTGRVSAVKTAYDAAYGNITVEILVTGRESKPIKCYRLKGDGAENIKVGDTITVSGTLKNYNGTIEFDAGCMLDELIPGEPIDVEVPADPMQIVQEAYALEDGTSLNYEATLTGTIISVDTPYDAGYQNVTVTITVAGCEDMPIKCYRLKGTGADTIAVGDEITVTGTLTKYNGVVEFAQGCTLDTAPVGDSTVAPTDPLQIVDEAYLLAKDTALTYQPTLTGKITSIDTPYDATYQNVTVTMVVTGRESKPIQCYRLKGTGADTLAVGDTITVAGVLKNYAGKVQFDANCMLTNVVKGTTDPVDIPTDPLAIIDAGYALAENAELPYNCSLTGKISSIDTAYDATYKNVTVTFKVGGRDNKPIQAYRIGGTGADKLAVGDTITVVGKLKNYGGKIQLINGTITGYISGGGSAPVVETDPMKIVDAAYGLAKDTQMAYDVTLTGRVSAVKTAYDATFKNITVEILVTGRESKPILCYRLKGDGCDKIAVNDTIQVVGRIKNYNGTIEFDAGCTLLSRKSGGGAPVVVETDPAKIMAAAGKLAENTELSYEVTLSGKVTSVDEAYDAEYQNVTATIAVSGANNQALKLYRLKGDGVDQLAVGDTITAKGKIKNHYGTIEMVNGTMTARTSGGGKPPVAQTDYKKIVDEAYALANGASLSYTATLEGRITELQSPYDAAYGNMTVAIVVVGREDKPIVCYRMKGDSIGNHLCVGDTITVEGKIKNYNGTIEFDSGCKMIDRKAGSASKPSDPKKIVDAAFALAENTSLPYFSTLTGVVKSIDEPYTDQYKNVTLTMTVQGSNGAKDIKVYRMKGNDAANVAVGNTITVTGAIKNYVGTDKETGEKKPPVIEFDSGCFLETLIR